jgi:hypothetical protein
MMATPMDVLWAEASLKPMAIGMVPAINARLVIKIGRSLTLQALMMAWLRSMPLCIS